MPFQLSPEIIIWILTAVLALAGFSALARNRREKVLGLGRNTFATVSVGLALLLGAWQLGYLNTWGLNPLAVTTTTTTVLAPQISGCAVEDTTVTLSAIDAATAAPSGGAHAYRVNGNPIVELANAGTFTASPGDSIEVLFMNESSGSYFGEKKTEIVPCSGTQTISGKVWQNGSVTIQAFNEEGDVITNTGIANETVAAGDVVTLKLEVKGTYQRGFPHGGIMVAEYDTSAFDQVIVDLGGGSASVPVSYVPIRNNNRTIAYGVPALLSNQILEGKVTLDTHNSNNPGADDDISLVFYSNDYFVNGDTGGTFDGPAVEDEDNALNLAHRTAYTLGVD